MEPPLTVETQAAVLFELGEPLRVIQLSTPPLKPGQLLVDIAYSGICHTQLLEARGKRGEDRFLPHTLGHEGSGTVLETGPGVGKVKPGDRVVLSWIKGSGADVPSTVYGSAEGSINSGAMSTFMLQTVTCENRVTRIPDDVPLREGALLGCAFPTGAGVVFNTAQVAEGNSVAIFGVGGIGLSAVLAAALADASQVIAVDVLDHKLELARRAGATHVVNARTQDPLASILEVTHGRGVDYSIEAAGKQSSMALAFRCVRENGGLCVIAGNLPFGEMLSLDPMELIRGKRIVGTWGGETVPDRDIPRYAELCLAGKLRAEQLVTHEYSLDDVNRGLEDLEAGGVGRGLICMTDDSP